MTLVEQIRQLKAELEQCEGRAAAIRRLLADVVAAAEIAPPTPATSTDTQDAIAFLRLMHGGPRTTSELLGLTQRSRGTCLRVLDTLAADELVVGTGTGSGRRWHLTDLGVARVAASAPLETPPITM